MKLCCIFATMFQMSRFVLSLIFLLGMQQLQAQCTLTLSGHINDAETKEHLDEAVILIKELKLKQISDKDGFFVFKGLCPGTYTVEITHVGCIPAEKHIHLKADLETDIDLAHAVTELSEVVVQGDRYSKNVIPVSEIKGKALEATRGLSLAESIILGRKSMVR